MSGDVQPRKRKDKRRKKEGTSLGSIHEPVISHKFKRSESDDLKIFDVPDQGEKIHVQNEHGVGGNICVKIIFFCLFGLLVGAVGLIYMKSQGSTDVDLPTIEESRFAEYFTGWLDDSTDDHEHEVHENNIDHEDNDEHDEHDDHDDHEDQDEDDHEEEDQSPEKVSDPIFKLFGLQSDEPDEVEENDVQSKEVLESESRPMEDVDEDEDEEEDEKEDEEDEEKDEVEQTEEEEEEEEKNEADDTEEEEEEEKDAEDDTEEEEKHEVDATEEEEDKDSNDDDSGVDLNEQNEDDDDEDDDDLFQVDEEDDDRYEKRSKEQITAAGSGRDDDDDEDSEEKKLSAEEQLEEDNEDEKDDLEESAEVEKDEREDEESAEKKYQKSKVDTDDLGFDEIDVSEEDLGEDLKDKDQDEEDSKQLKGGKPEEQMKKQKTDQLESGIETDSDDTEDDAEGGGGVAVKLGVGIALIIVAHLVLVKKWKSMTNVPSDENVPTVAETPSEKKEIENLHSTVEPVISRRQTLVPEDISLNGDPEDEEEMEDEEEEELEEEEEGVEDDEAYSEEECEEEEYKKSKIDANWEKPTWNIRKDEKEQEDDVDNEEEVEYDEEYEEEDVEEVEDEQEQDEEEEEEEVDDDEEEYEEDDDVEDDSHVLKQKLVAAVPDKRQEEVKESAPTPPPRSRRGAQDFDEEFFDFEGINQFEETSEQAPKEVDEIISNSIPEEEKAPEKKVGSEDEWAFRQELDFAEEQLENNPKVALDVYEKIISKKPTLIRALIGRAKALDHWAEKEKSNTYLKQATNAYKTVLLEHGQRLDDDSYVKLAERCIERMRFAGNFISAIDIHKALILKYPNTPKYRNTLAVTYLMLNKIPQARVLLNETLNLWPDNGFALVHYGFILKTSDNNMEEGAKKLMAGIKTREEGVIDGMFFFHLGDALNRLGREKEAMVWYELGVKEGLFLSKYQRSLYNVNRLKGQPWWTKEETTYQDFFKKLEDNWREIRREGLELLNSRGINLFKEEAENLKDTGDWKQLDLYFRGRKQANCNKAPITCALVSSFKPASTCTRGQIKFSVMLPNTHVWPHCGPTNCRLRSHLGLVVPKKTFIRVAEETRSWEEGKFLIFDDSFEHEVWHNGTGLRLVLIVDVWHPELTYQERRVLSPI